MVVIYTEYQLRLYH